MRYLRILWIQVRASLAVGMQYRFDFVVEGALTAFWMLVTLTPLFVVFGARHDLAGWTFGEALLVTGWFTLLQGVLEGAINPSLVAVVEHIRKGTLDFVLLKPADAQFLVSTTRFQPWRAVNVVTSIGVFAWGFHLLGRVPSLGDVALATVAMVIAVVVLYSLWIVTVCAAFYFVRIDNLTQLFIAVFDAARWPIGVFRGAVRALFTFLIPLALMTTYPAEALLGWLRPGTLVASMAGALLAFGVSRTVWLRSIGRYTSAGG